jgi:hypothetical protein
MTKGAKTLLFIVVATLVNLGMTLLYFVALLALYGLTLGRVLKVTTAAPVLLIVFVGSVVLGSLTYGKLLKVFRKKYKLEEFLGRK